MIDEETKQLANDTTCGLFVVMVLLIPWLALVTFFIVLAYRAGMGI